MTLRLLVISVTIYFLALLIAALGTELGIARSNQSTIIFVLVIVGLTLNIIGVIKGFQERTKHWEAAANGIIGNSIPLILLLIVVGSIVYFFGQLGPM